MGRRRNGGNGAKEQKRESTFYGLPHNIKGEKRIWEWRTAIKKGARKRKIILLCMPFFPHLFFDLIWIYACSYFFSRSVSLPYHGAIFASPAAVTTRPNTSLTKEKKIRPRHTRLSREQKEKKGKKYQISRISPPLSPQNAVTGDTPPAPPRGGGGRHRWVSYINVFLREIKLRFLNLQIYHAERTRSLTPPLQWTFPSGSTVSF